jgi:CspA family cold shock protein
MGAVQMGLAMSQEGQSLKAQTGVVKWFDPKKGFGFVVGPDSQDIFVHYTTIVGDGFRVLKDGSMVEYDAVYVENRWRSTRVVRQEAVSDVQVRPMRGYARSPRR